MMMSENLFESSELCLTFSHFKLEMNRVWAGLQNGLESAIGLAQVRVFQRKWRDWQ